jgi:hypothetical protein
VALKKANTESSSLVVLGLRPQLPDWDHRFRSHIHRPFVLLRYAAAAGDDRGPLDASVDLPNVVSGNPDGDHDLPRAAPRSPQMVVVMPAYGRWKVVSATQEVERAGLPVVGGEDAGRAPLFGGKTVVGVRHGARHILPPKPVPEGRGTIPCTWSM